MAPTPSSTEPEREPTTASEPEEPVASPTAEPTPVPVTEELAAAPTAEPTVASKTEEPATAPTAEPTMTPKTEEPTMYEAYTPMPVTTRDPVDEPLAAPKTLTLAPATFAPSVTAPMPDGECKDPVAAFSQVGASRARCFSWYALWVFQECRGLRCMRDKGGKGLVDALPCPSSTYTAAGSRS